MTDKKVITVALVGNPNCGKTTLFNALTGSRQFVGNWAGVTVEKIVGEIKDGDCDIEIVDLPGIYSLSPYTSEEILTRKYLIDESPDIIINIIDATNIERNLYLTTELIELNKPIIVALNMIDIVEKYGDKIDINKLENIFKLTIIPISASKHIGLNKLINEMKNIGKNNEIKSELKIYDFELEKILSKIQQVIMKNDLAYQKYSRWISVKIFENDSKLLKKIELKENEIKKIELYIDSMKQGDLSDREMIIADQRYKFICDAVNKCVVRNTRNESKNISDEIDSIVTNKYLAIPVFLTVMFSAFLITFGNFGGMLRGGMYYFINDIVCRNIFSLLKTLDANELIISLTVDGILAGVGSVLSFLPQIILLFLFLSFLEDSGYMSRAVFIMDKLLGHIGLSGKAFVPMLMGFGCTVPAILATRTLENAKDKRLAILITPFMSCSAKMPVYLFFVPIFFKGLEAYVIFSLYLLGIIVAILSAILFNHTLLKGENAPLILEMPPYRMPSAKNLIIHSWQRVKDFLIRAGTVLFVATIFIWFLKSFDFSLCYVSNSSLSMLATLGKCITPLFSVCGFNDWRMSVSLISGIMAKESIISTMSVLYNGNINLIENAFTLPSAISYLSFILCYTPCIAALSVIKKEMASFKWTLFSIVYQLVTAFVISFLVYHIADILIN